MNSGSHNWTNLDHSQVLVVEVQQGAVSTLILLSDFVILEVAADEYVSVLSCHSSCCTYRAAIQPWI